MVSWGSKFSFKEYLFGQQCVCPGNKMSTFNLLIVNLDKALNLTNKDKNSHFVTFVDSSASCRWCLESTSYSCRKSLTLSFYLLIHGLLQVLSRAVVVTCLLPPPEHLVLLILT